MTTHHDLTVDGVRAAVAAVLDVDVSAVGAEANLLALGVDSMKLMALASQWQRHGAEVPFLDLAENPTPAHWSRLLIEAASPATA